MVVHHVEKDRQAGGVAGVHQLLQSMRPAVTVLGRIQLHAIVAPIAIAGELRHRHDLHGRDAQLAQLVQTADDGLERPLRGERADVQLVENQVFAAHAFPTRIGPDEALRADDRRGGVNAIGLR